MKKLLFLLPVILLFATACDSNDDGFYNTKYINATGLATIEAQPSYTVGDALFVSATIPNLLPEPGQTNPLNIRETTGDAPTFNFSFLLEKNTSESTWEPVDLTGNFIEDLGDANAGSFVEGFAQYNSVADAYLFRGGIELLQPGTYRLSFGFNSSSQDKVEFLSDSRDNHVTLNIASSIIGLEPNGFYTFTVN